MNVALSVLLVAASAAPPADPEAILSRARTVQEEDLRSWARFSFHRRVEREQFDEAGTVVRREVIESRVTPGPDGFDELLLGVDGREPSAAEVRRFRRDAPFTRHYRTTLQGDSGDEGDGGYSLRFLLRGAVYRYRGVEEIAGVPCHRFEFQPDPEAEGHGRGARVAAAMAGSLWVSLDGSHLVRAEAASLRPVSLVSFLVRLESLGVELEAMRVDGEAWLPRRLMVRSEARVVGFPTRRRNTFTYDAFLATEGPHDRIDP